MSEIEARVIKEVWFGVGQESERVSGDENHVLHYVNEYHGTYDENWIVMLRKSDMKEVQRHNPRMATTIIWADPK